MKHLNLLFPVLLCTLLLGLSSCKETNADRLAGDAWRLGEREEPSGVFPL